MRIPSQFNDSSLYGTRSRDKGRTKGRGVPPSGTARRLIRLAVAFALVIVVMRQARQPRLYQAFFSKAGHATQSPGAESRTDGNLGLTNASKVMSSTEAASEQSIATSSPDNWPLAAAWVETMEVDLQRAWIQTLLMVQHHLREHPPGSDESFDWVGVSETQIKQSIELLRGVQAEQRGDDDTVATSTATVLDQLQTLSRLADQGRLSVSHLPRIQSWAAATLDALDRAALSRVQDGTFWTSVDSDAFYLQLARSDQLAIKRGRSGAVAIGTLPLLQQPDVYRGQTVRIEGSLRRATRIDAQPNRAGVKHYWKLWVIPNDGGVRPLVLIVPTLPESLRPILTDDGSLDPQAVQAHADQLIAVGRFIKRLPYRSSIGADIAPVVIGRIEATQADRLRQRSSASGIADGLDHPVGNHAKAANGGQSVSRLSAARWWGIAVAIIAGVGFAVVLMRRATAEAAHTRHMRRNSLDREGFDADLLAGDTTSQSTQKDPA